MADRFTFFKSYYNAAKKLPEDQRLKFYDGIFELAFEQRYPSHEEGSLLDMAYTVILPHVEKSIEMSERGKKGGRPRKSEE